MEQLVKAGAEPLRLQLVVADFASLPEVAAMAETLASTMPCLNAVINHAAIAGPARRTYSEDGNELTFQVNYLAPRLLTTKLMPSLMEGNGRVINVSSVLHRGGSIGWNDLARRRHYSSLSMYAQSKLALTMYTKSLASTTEVTAISVHTGPPSHHAAQLLVDLSSRDFPVINGGFYEGRELGRAAAMVENPRARERLEKVSACLLASAM